METLVTFLRELTLVRGTVPIRYTAKLEAESGIDLEDLAKSGKIVVEGEEVYVEFRFNAYTRNHYERFEVGADHSSIKVGKSFLPLNDDTKVLLIRELIVPAMRHATREELWKQQLHQRLESVRRVKKSLSDEDIANIFEGMLKQ